MKRVIVRSLVIWGITGGCVYANQAEELQALREQVRALSAKIEKMEKKQNEGGSSSVAVSMTSSAAQPAASGGSDSSVVRQPANVDSMLSAPKTTPLSAFNPEVSVALDGIASYAREADNVGFTPRDLELMLKANVDQLARGYIVFNGETDFDPYTQERNAEADFEVEEAAIETTNLPYGLQIRAGKYFADFSRLGRVHNHELPFADRPLVLSQLLGGELVAQGVELNWVPQIDHYFRFTAGVSDRFGHDLPTSGQFFERGVEHEAVDGHDHGVSAFQYGDQRRAGDLVFYGRAATILEMGDASQLALGSYYANESQALEIAGADFKYTWQPLGSYDRLQVGGEALYGKFSGRLNDELVAAGGPTRGAAISRGAYVYAQYRIGQKWEPGMRYDWLTTNQFGIDEDGNFAREARTVNAVSGYLNYHLSETNRLRVGLQKRDESPRDWFAYLQWTITFGPHVHSFQP